MSRMIPAKVRAAGIKLYQEGHLTRPNFSELKISAVVDGEQVVYDLDGQADSCSCADFKRNQRYCPHIAAIEEYLKNEKAETITYELEKRDKDAQKSRYFQDSLDFLNYLSPEIGTDSMDSSVETIEGGWLLESEIFTAALADGHFDSTLALSASLGMKRENDAHYYVIRDIPIFLRALKKGQPYTLGFHYIRRLSISYFEPASRALLEFLLRVSLDFSRESDFLYQKGGRYLFLPRAIVSRFLSLTADLPSFSLELEETKVSYFAQLALGKDSGIFSFVVTSEEDWLSLLISEKSFLSFYEGTLLYYDHTFYEVSAQKREWISRLGSLPKQNGDCHLRIDYDDKEQLAQALRIFTELGKVVAPEALTIRSFQPIFNFSTADRKLILSIVFDFGDFNVRSFSDLETLDFSRDLLLENRLFSLVQSADFQKSFQSMKELPKGEELYAFFEQLLPRFEALGQVHLAPELEKLRIKQLEPLKVVSQGSLLDVSFDLPDISDDDFAELIKRLRKNDTHYITENGQVVLFGEGFDGLRKTLQNLDSSLKIKKKGLELPIYKSFQLSGLLEGLDSEKFPQELQEFYRHITHPETFPYKKSAQLKAKLRPYQETGVRFLKMLSHYQLSGILADDMGLGKTVQAIAYLLSEMKEDAKTLIIAPSSLIYNWESEIEKFSAGLDTVVVHGSLPERHQILEEGHQIYITSYGSFLKDSLLYQKESFQTLFLDEAQFVKNYSSKTMQALMKLKADHKFALTGTPMENKIEELWSLFQLLLPDLLPDRKAFAKLSEAEVVKLIQPFILRRKKEEVLDELPEKMETTVYCDLTTEQKTIYMAQLEAMRSQISAMTRSQFTRSQIEILAGITRLRQICDSPSLFMEDYQDGSGKLDALAELLAQIKDSGHRPLIFSQFTKLFPAIEQIMTDIGLSYYKITGSTPAMDRLKQVKAFNTGSRDVFLISLKAGGVGLNLTSSDVVILVDLWWNPAVEDQAVSRAHRMGQKKTVEVIRLVTRGTIEEKIKEIQQRKQALFTAIVDNGESRDSLKQSEIMEILGIKHLKTEPFI